MSNESTTAKPFKPDKVSKGKILSYGMAPFISNMTVASYNMLVFYYYEVELGLSIALVGLSYVIYAIWNMLNDPLIGFLTDKPMRWSRKYGLRTPWIIVGGILVIISYYFLYAVPDVGDVKSNPWPLFWYMVFITCLFDTFFSIFQIHFSAGFGNIFRSKDDRRKGSMIIGLFAVCSGMFIRIVIIANVVVFGDPSSFVRAALLTGVVSFIALILLLPGIHESETVKQRYFQIYEFLELQKMPYFKLLKLAFKQKGYVAFTIALTLHQCARLLRIASELYMIKDVLNLDMTAIALLSFIFLICFIPSMILSSFIVKKIGHANLWIICLILLVFFYISALWITTLTQLIILYVLYGVVIGAQSSVMYAMIADTNDQVVSAAERHVEGTLGGIRTFFTRMAYIVTGAIIAGIHLATGYIPGASTQTPLALMGVRMHYGGVPALFVGIAAILMFKFYDIKGEKREQLMASLKAKRL